MQRLFWGFEVVSPWPEIFPKGRILNAEQRHMTLLFLGKTDPSKLIESLVDFPPIPFKLGLVGKFNEALFLPSKRHPNVLAWGVEWWDQSDQLISFQKDIAIWHLERKLIENPTRDHHFLPHVTLCRDPKNLEEWEKTFTPLPMMIKNFHLYESLGNSQYKPLYTFPLAIPFEEIEHTADIAFNIFGDSLDQIRIHALSALSFHYPALANYYESANGFRSLDEVIENLNKIISKVDQEISCPYKAISYHGDILISDGIMNWEMIVDV